MAGTGTHGGERRGIVGEGEREGEEREAVRKALGGSPLVMSRLMERGGV